MDFRKPVMASYTMLMMFTELNLNILILFSVIFCSLIAHMKFACTVSWASEHATFSLTDYADDDDIEGGPEDEGFEGGKIPFYGKQSKEIFDKTFDKLVNDEKTSLRLMLVVFPVHLHAPFDIRFNVMCHNFFISCTF